MRIFDYFKNEDWTADEARRVFDKPSTPKIKKWGRRRVQNQIKWMCGWGLHKECLVGDLTLEDKEYWIGLGYRLEEYSSNENYMYSICWD